ncbi:MAG: glycosyl transferase-like protein [Nisaea sp.]|nr:glycosyl transferase-like protein [Nisaea sp.]OUX92210.1 MAG: hypothetical protein CBB86_12395 [Candidatus Endolissoclinum sp. TMED26]
MNDISDMTKNTANAALFYQGDAFDASRAKVMGRNVAGATFLGAFLKYANVDQWLAAVQTRGDEEKFKQQVADICDANGLPAKPTSVVGNQNFKAFTDVGCYFLPDPGIGRHTWLRREHNQRAFSFCGITHTIASNNVMDQFTTTFLTPVQSWDAVICTSKSVRQAVEQLADGYAEFIEARFGVRPKLPMQLPIIPLGTDGDLGRSRRDNAAGRKALRAQYGVAEDDVVIMFFGRLSFHAKAHPTPMLQAVEEAAGRLPNTKLHIFMVGQFYNEAIEATFHSLSKEICSASTCHFLDGAQPDVAEASWAAADIFLSLSDNIQESFGLTPLEAMAAGLPCVVSDWDGYKDTVIEGETGFRIPSVIPPPGSGTSIGNAHGVDQLTYDHYIAAVSQTTAIDIPAAADAIAKLADEPELRRKMAAAGQQHIATTLDWAQIIPQYQELWADLAARRVLDAESAPRGKGRSMNPSRPDPFDMFKNHATHILSADDEIGPGTVDPVEIKQLINETHYNVTGGLFFSEDEIAMVLAKVGAGRTTVKDMITTLSPRHAAQISRGLTWLYKFGLITISKK